MKNFEPKVEMWDIARIKPYEKNAKKHPPEQIAKLAVAFDTFGFDVPLVVDSTGSLLKGHGRYLALKSQNRKQVPVIVRNDLSPDEIKAARLADNKLAESAWDNDFLSSEMIELYDAEFPIDVIGFSAAETAQLFGIELDEPKDEPAAVDGGDRFLLLLEFRGEEEQQAMFSELQGRGVECKIMN